MPERTLCVLLVVSRTARVSYLRERPKRGCPTETYKHVSDEAVAKPRPTGYLCCHQGARFGLKQQDDLRDLLVAEDACGDTACREVPVHDMSSVNLKGSPSTD